MKLALDEPEETALREQLDAWDGLVSSALLRVEALRACDHYGLERTARATAGLGAVTLIPLDDLAMFVYDERLAGAAREAGIHVEAPA